MIWGGAALFAVLGMVFIASRRSLSRFQAMIFGGSIVPGCVVIEAVVLFLIAIVIVALRLRGVV